MILISARVDVILSRHFKHNVFILNIYFRKEFQMDDFPDLDFQPPLTPQEGRDILEEVLHPPSIGANVEVMNNMQGEGHFIGIDFLKYSLLSYKTLSLRATLYN